MTKSESSNTSQSSSTSSDSSDVSSDDEQTIEMIQNAIPDFESFGRNVINKTKERYALVIHDINREIKAIKAKEKEERKELQRTQE